MTDGGERIKELERELADLERRLPAHSVRPAMLLRMEEIEEELARLRQGGESS